MLNNAEYKLLVFGFPYPQTPSDAHTMGAMCGNVATAAPLRYQTWKAVRVGTLGRELQRGFFDIRHHVPKT